MHDSSLQKSAGQVPKVDVSVVVPAFNEEETLPYSHARISKALLQSEALPGEKFEILYVNDGSSDGTQKVLQKIQGEAWDPRLRVRVLQFSRNFGHSSAVLAGLTKSHGQLIAIIDADMQDPPELIPKMIASLREGNDVVYGLRQEREGETFFKKTTAWFFYRLLNFMTGVKIPNDTGDFRVMTRQVADAVVSCGDQEPFMRGLVAWVGFQQKAYPYKREARKHGETKYPLRKMLKFAATAIVSFSSAPLRLATFLGFVGLVFSVIIGVWALSVRAQGFAIPGWTSLMLGVLIGNSFSLLTIGIIGTYIGHIHRQVQHRPRYILKSEES